MPTVTSRPGRAEASAPRRRDPWIDNAKTVLVTLVVVGHLLTIAPESAPAAHAYDFLYLFHIPAFVLVSGWTSRNASWSRRHLTQLVTVFLVPYLLLSTAMGWVRVNVSDDVSSLESLKPWWIDPSWPFWYLLAMVVWRLVTPIVRRHWLWLPGAVLLSLVVGRWDLPWLDLNRVIGFLPFYVLGVHLPGWLTVLLKRRISVPFALVAMAGLWWFSAHTDTWFPTEWLYYRTPYGHLDASTEQGMAIRALLLALGLVGSLAVLALLPRRNHAITAMGAWTMVVYLLHGFVMQGVIALDLVDLLPDHAWTQVLSVIGFAVALAFFLGWPPVAKRLSWIVDPIDAVRSLRRRRG